MNEELAHNFEPLSISADDHCFWKREKGLHIEVNNDTIKVACIC